MNLVELDVAAALVADRSSVDLDLAPAVVVQRQALFEAVDALDAAAQRDGVALGIAADPVEIVDAHHAAAVHAAEAHLVADLQRAPPEHRRRHPERVLAAL